MALHLKSLPCPHCQQSIHKSQLQQQQLLKKYLSSKPFPCPNCSEKIIYPENADQLLSIGLLFTMILAPLFHLWQVEWFDSRLLLGAGIIITLMGIFTRKLAKYTIT